MATRSVMIAILLACLLVVAQKHEPADTSVSAIAANPAKFHNRIVRVRGTAYSGMEASVLIDTKDGQAKKEYGRINLEFDSARSDETTSRFLQLFGEQIKPPKCNTDERLVQGFRHALDPSVPAPPPCVTYICGWCPRYSIVGTFTGKLRYSGKEPGHVGFGHVGMFNLQLDVAKVANLEVTDNAAHPEQ